MKYFQFLPLKSLLLFSVDGMQEIYIYIFTSQHVFIFCPYFFIFMHLFPSLYVACAFIFMLLPLPSPTACFSATLALLQFSSHFDISGKHLSRNSVFEYNI